MSGLLQHDPSDIIRWLLVAIGQGSDPTMSHAWPACIVEVDSPDEIIVVTDTAGRMDGRNQHTGEQDSHPGVQIKVRSSTKKASRSKAKLIAAALDESVYRNAVTIDGVTYCVQSVSRTGDILSMGKETGSSKRSLHSINAVVCLSQV